MPVCITPGIDKVTGAIESAIPISSSMATLKGIFPNPKPTRRKNFIQENVKNLRRMEQFFHSKEVEDLQKLQLQKKSLDKYQNVASRINSSVKSGKSHDAVRKTEFRHSDTNLADDSRLQRKTSDPMQGKNVATNKKIHRGPLKMNPVAKLQTDERLQSSKTRESQVTKACAVPNLYQEDSVGTNGNENNCMKYRNQGIQTLATNDMGTLYREGVIRYPSSRGSKNDPSHIHNAEGSPRQECLPSDRDYISPASPRRLSFFSGKVSSSDPGDDVDHAKLNKQKASKMATQLNNGVPPASYRKGVVPKYIRDRKEAQQQRDEKIKAAASRADCPKGHVPLPDEERKETLRMLKIHYQEYVKELNMMPIRTDTLRAQRRKMEIEKQLNKLEEGIKVFSRPEVNVKVNV